MSLIVTITGPSGAGKTTLERMMREYGYVPIVSTTTRAPRANEAHGRAYHFETRESFRADVQAGEFVEWAAFNGALYGVRKADFEAAQGKGRPIVVVLEPSGMRNLRAYCAERGLAVYSVFLDQPPLALVRRVLARKTLDHVPLRTTLSRLWVLLTREIFWKWAYRWDELLRIRSADGVPAEAYRLHTLRWGSLDSDSS